VLPDASRHRDEAVEKSWRNPSRECPSGCFSTKAVRLCAHPIHLEGSSLVANIESRRAEDGTLSHRVKVRLKGHSTETATFARLTDAKRWAQATESAIREGRYFRTAEAKRHTLADLVDRYIAEVLPHKPKNASNTKLQLLWWKDKLGHLCLADLNAAAIVQCRNDLMGTITRRQRPMSPSTVVRYMAALSHAVNIAMKDWGWLEDTPMRKVSKPREPRGRDRFLSDDERRTLLSACKESSSRWLYAVVVLALSTGMRSGEIMGLRWSQIDLIRGQVLLRDTKNGASRAVPLAGLALELIQAAGKVRRIDTDLVFYGNEPKRPGEAIKAVDLKKPWTTAMTKAKLKDFRFHDLRHSAASYLAMNGASTIEIAAVLGHKTLQMVKRYSHLSNSHASAVVTAMNQKIFGA
jgi:integrase